MDRGQLHQVVMNLVLNARDAMPAGGKLTISTGRRSFSEEDAFLRNLPKAGTYAAITVKDTGTGIDRPIRERMFEPFFTTKEVGKGTGLGLSISYGIIRQHGGAIEVDSVPGCGSSFTAYLPLSVSEETSFPSVAGATPAGGTETVLLAEDEEIVRNYLTEVLRQAGYEVIAAADGAEAISLFTRFGDSISILVTDVVMPSKNGREVYEEISRMRPALPAIFTTGHCTDVLRRKGIFAEDFVFLRKPVAKNDLLRAVRRALGAGRSQEPLHQ